MRFVSGGPTLPDELLTARDAGEVLFFCGAGVSQAEADLPSFAMLAEKVLSRLGSALDSPARRLFQAAQAFEKASGLTGLVATDRVFGMLEHEFEPSEVREAVAAALKPEPGCSLAAHRTLLDLSRTRSGVARLVTTNFDLLFEECDAALLSANPPHLPDPRRELDFRGVIHIHGRVDQDYSRACDDEFVLSSADFGRAYLSDGWATRYIQALLARFKIVFVGYRADDPPVQYLLEALSRSEDSSNDLYAFQSGEVAQAAQQWAHKGVCPIAYSSDDRHAALWNTLRAWAERARDVDGWHRQIIATGSAGPETLLPFQRGMIAHLASTKDGARHLAVVAEPPPAEWLAVFDLRMRYGQAGQLDIYDERSPRFDPIRCLRSRLRRATRGHRSRKPILRKEGAGRRMGCFRFHGGRSGWLGRGGDRPVPRLSRWLTRRVAGAAAAAGHVLVPRCSPARSLVVGGAPVPTAFSPAAEHRMVVAARFRPLLRGDARWMACAADCLAATKPKRS